MDIQAFKDKAARAEARADAAEAAMMTNKKKKRPPKDNTMKSNLISSNGTSGLERASESEAVSSRKNLRE